MKHSECRVVEARPARFRITPEQSFGLRVSIEWVNAGDAGGRSIQLSVVRTGTAEGIPTRAALTLRGGRSMTWSAPIEPVSGHRASGGGSGEHVGEVPLTLSFFLDPVLLEQSEVSVLCTPEGPAGGRAYAALEGTTYWFLLKDFLTSPA